MSQTPATEIGATREAQNHSPRKGGLEKVLVALFLVGIVGTECLVVYLFLPSETDTAALASGGTSLDQNSGGHSISVSSEPLTEALSVPQVEVDLGDFSVTSYQPISNTTLRIDFHLYGTVATEDQKAFQEALQANIHRFRDQVISVIRSAELTDLTDAGLGLIKRKILEKTNALLGKRYLKAVIFSDFSFIEQ
ncbi:MAG: flagellar basal body-associated FliL family protein [Thermoguttaceae bacterium]|nr:flagellar basal body-associated FliL family protein [Thermoguttaceae bacterium]MDW8037272.1 flagellar basal body-associated FliL family protein [Thermoguttaceae bacterium]